MLSINIDKAIDITTGLTLGFFSIGGYMCRYNRTVSNENNQESNDSTTGNCVMAKKNSCSSVNTNLGIQMGMITSALYLYRGFRHH